MSKLNQEELLSWLAWWQSFCRKGCDSNICFIAGGDKKRCEQAYNQIKDMIQKYSKYTEEVKKSMIALKKMRKRIQQKPEVTEEFVEKWEDEFYYADYHMTSEETKRLLRQMLTEAGVEVVEK